MSTLGDMDGMLPSTKKALKQASSQKKALIFGWSGETEPIDAKYATVYSFGEYKGTGEDCRQDMWVKDVLRNLQQKDENGEYKKNGVYVNMNYGHGTKDYYYFYNGYLYKVNSVPKNSQVIDSKKIYK